MNKLGSSHRVPLPMEDLPRDVLHYELFPFLDYSTRVAMNQVLPRAERKPTPLKKGVIQEFSALFARCMIQRLMQSMMNDAPTTLLQNCRAFNQSYLGCLVYFPIFRMRFMSAVLQVQWRFSAEEGFILWQRREMTELNEFFHYCTVACESAATVIRKKMVFQSEFSPVTGIGDIVENIPFLDLCDDELWDLGFV